MQSMPIWLLLIILLVVFLWGIMSLCMYIRASSNQKLKSHQAQLAPQGWFQGVAHILWALSVAIALMTFIMLVVAFSS